MKSGFSLVELSIVLVILGLLTGGILSGQALIRAAELRTVATDISRYTAALHAFRDRYMAIPGDFHKATKFWGVLAGTGSDTTCRETAATSAATCDGNGDGYISTGSGGTSVNNNEMFRAWQHLANAGLIEGSYTGMSTGGENWMQKVPGVNVPPSKLGNAAYIMAYRNTPGVQPGEFSVDANLIVLATWSGNTSSTGVMRGDEMWSLDTKLDDSKPATGRLRSWFNGTGAPNCVTGDDSDTANYTLSSNASDCRLRFLPLN